MSGVDLTDQAVSYSTLSHCMLKWWKKVVLCNLLEITVSNAKIIYKKVREEHGRFNNDKFRLAVIEGLLDGYNRPQRTLGRLSGERLERLVGRHFPTKYLRVSTGGKTAYPECEVCSNRKVKRHQTTTYREECKVALCIEPCFQRYHTMVNYKIDCHQGFHK